MSEDPRGAAAAALRERSFADTRQLPTSNSIQRLQAQSDHDSSA